MALCSESTGSNLAFDLFSSLINISPEETKHSLLANATVVPFYMAATVGSNPAEPTIAAISKSTSLSPASIIAFSPEAT